MPRNVVIGYLYGDFITQHFHHCLLRAFIHDLCGSNRILNFIPTYANVNIGGPRNRVVRDFLATPGAEWLWLLDTDATFSASLLDDLLAVADPSDIPVLGALTHRLRATGGFDVTEMPTREIIPVAFQDIYNGDKWTGYSELSAHSGDGLLQVDETGCHCLLVHRKVLEALDAPEPYPWFSEQVIGGATIGEDISFCRKVRAAGYPIHIDTRLESGHAKLMVLTSRGAT